uniref:10.2 kDa salivary secreted WC protein n=1 Tax=Ixodes scapularis TaxID=6945 RepID=Q4PN77_IXOSC|nr:10.2 kDa salivary secreted WC protein [Ixodes scapularis]
MQLAVFVMVLIPPALLSEGFLSDTVSSNDCMDLIDQGGHLKCGLDGSGDIDDYYPDTCSLKCSGGANPKLPSGVCSGGGVNCTRLVQETLRMWVEGLQHTQYKVLKKWCTCYSEK